MPAPTRVQATGRVTASSTLTVSLTFGSAPTLGNTVVVGVLRYQTGGGVAPVCTDNRGNTYSAAVWIGNIAACGVFVSTAPLLTGSPFTLTLTAPVAAYWEVVAIEVSGVVVVDQTAATTGSSTTPATGPTPAITGPDVFIVGVHHVNANQASITVESVSPAWTEELESLSFSATIAGEIDSRSLTGVAGTTPSCSWTLATSSSWDAVVAVFRSSAPAAVARADPYVWGPL